MTQEDMRTQKGLAMADFDTQQTECAHLYAKLRDIGQRFQEFGGFLANDPIGRVYGPSSAHSGFDIKPLDVYYHQKLDFAEAVKTADELRQSMKKLNELEQLCAGLGANIHRTLPHPKRMQIY